VAALPQWSVHPVGIDVSISGNPTNPSPDPWRQKYYDSLNELEVREREWTELESLLRRSISHLTLLGDGQDPQLDEKLEYLRNIIREEKDKGRIKRLVEGVARSAEQVQRAISKTQNRPPDSAEVLGRLIESIPFPESQKRQVEKFARSLLNKRDVDEPQLIADFTALVVNAIGEPTGEEPEQRPRGGLLKKIFSHDEPHDSTAVGSEGIDPGEGGSGLPVGDVVKILLRMLRELALPASLDRDIAQLRQSIQNANTQRKLDRWCMETARLINRHLGNETTSATIEDTGEDLGVAPGLSATEALSCLLDTFSLPAEMEVIASGLKEKLIANPKPKELPKIIKSIAAMVTELRQAVYKERRELEKFLKQLTDNLQEIDRGLQGTDSDRRESLANSKKLQNEVHTQVEGLELSVREAQDIDRLKVEASERLTAIRLHMSQYIEKEEKRSQNSEKKIKRLTIKLHKMEDESSGLRQRVDEARKQALQDSLTGLFNRLAFDERMATEYDRWRRYQAPLSIAIWDLDHFKHINDNYGHKAGDKVLQAVGQMLATRLRSADFTARYGGEEFVTLMPETVLKDAMVMTEKFRQLIDTTGFHHSGEKVSVTISCGVAEFHNGDTTESVFERVDQALYRAKDNGRNRCEAEVCN